MSYFLRKSILFGSRYVRTSIPGAFLQNRDFFSLRIRWLSSSSNPESFTVSYLIKSFGFSPEAALSASKKVKFENPMKPDKFIKVFKGYGFTETQISSLVRTSPAVLSLDAERIILPKLEFLKAKGLSDTEIAKKLPFCPGLLSTSLSKKIMPSYEFFRDLFQSDEKAIYTIKQFPDILRTGEKYVAPNAAILREHGVPDSSIATLLQNWPRSFLLAPCVFRKVVERVADMGFNALKVTFVVAVHVFRSVKESAWESRVDICKKWGWSEEEVLNSFKKYPWFMMASEDKMEAGMDFFINKMGWTPCLLAKHPLIFGMSLKRRVVPRCSVFQVLLSKDLVDKDVNIGSLLIVSEKKFLQKFIWPYEEKTPDLLKLYKEKLDLTSEPESNDKV